VATNKKSLKNKMKNNTVRDDLGLVPPGNYLLTYEINCHMIVPPFHGWMTKPPPPIEKRKNFSLSPSPQNPKKEKIAY
jgi:hypothetical protein